MSALTKYYNIGGNIYQRSRYIEFIREYNLIEDFIASKMSSPKRFCRERKGTLFKAYEVARRLEGK